MCFHKSCVMPCHLFCYSLYEDRMYFHAVWIRYSLLFYSLSEDTECSPSVWTSCHCLDISPDRLCLSAIILTSGWAGLAWESQGPSLDFSLTCGEQLTCFRQLCFQQHVMSLSCTYLEALSSSSFKCSNNMPH